MSSDRSLRGKVAVVGIGESTYYRYGRSPYAEFELLLQAILAACQDAGVPPSMIDGYSTYSNDRGLPTRIHTALGCDDIRLSSMQWGSGGGGTAASVGNAAAAIAAGSADCVVAYRGLAQGQYGRFGAGGGGARALSGTAKFTAPYGLLSAAQSYAMRVNRLFDEHKISSDTQKAVSLASYHHAQQNPRAVMRGRPLTPEAYDESRWIVEPFRLFDCCLENDGAAALLLMPAERARDFTDRPAYLLGVQQGGGFRSNASVHNVPDYATGSYKTASPRLFAQAGVTPADVDAVQIYENFTGGVVMGLIEHGFCSYENANEVVRFENLIAPSGHIPLNTSGGNLAECYMHGLGLIIEAARQIRGDSPNPIADAKVSFAAAAPMVEVGSSLIFGSEETL
jgi:acetyl-CoA acetyltransferase